MDQTSETEKEYQRSKYNEIIETLLNAGYYRVKINNLSEFDKVVGGVCWCITGSGEDVDVDILFQENSTIGQKIALSESLVQALRKMGCPHSLQPHQIQGGVGGSDYPVLHQVINWLIKKYLENKGERERKLRSFSTFQFAKNYQPPDGWSSDVGLSDNLKKIVNNRAKATRLFKSKEAIHASEETRVRAVLLEYGDSFIAKLEQAKSSSSKEEDRTSNSVGQESERISLADASSDVIIKNLAKLNVSELSGFEKQLAKAARDAEREELMIAEQASIEEVELKKQMMEVNGETPLAVTGSQLGSIVSQGGTNEMISALAAYQLELQESQRELESNLASGKLGQAAAFSRQKQNLLRQIGEMKIKEAEAKVAADSVIAQMTLIDDGRTAADQYVQKIQSQIRKLEQLEAAASQQQELQALKDLVAMNDESKTKEKAFKASCKEKMLDYTKRINQLEQQAADPHNEDNKKLTGVEEMHKKVLAKHSRMRAALGEVNLEVATFSRTIDETPTRTELIQYERRFVELYQQQVWKLEETKKYYDMYNTFDSTLSYLQKEVNLLNSISDNFREAMQSAPTKLEFSRQFVNIVNGVEASLKHQNQVLSAKDSDVDDLKLVHQNLVEQQRHYFKAVRDFQEECNKNDWLTTRFEQLQKGSN